MRKVPTVEFLWLCFIIIVPILTLWELLFHPGLYSYSDQHFPLSTTFPPSSIISSSVSGGFSFDRLIITWPYYVISAFTNSLELRIRGFLLYTFILYSFLCYTFSYLAVEYYSRHVATLSYASKQILKIPIFIVSYSNLSALNLNADGGTWADSVILILIAISLFLILDNNIQFKRYLIVSGFMMLTFFLDPDYAPMFLVAVLIISLTSGLSNRNLKRSLTYSIVAIGLSIFSLIFLFFQSSFISALTSSTFNALGYRAYTLGDLSFFSENINEYNVFILFGHLWSTLTFAPPSVLFLGSRISFLPSLYSPAQVLLPNNIISYLWLASLAVLPILAFSSIYFKASRKTALQIIPLVVIAYLITEEWNFRLVYLTLKPMTDIPVIGSAIGTSLTLPGHFINFLAFLYLPLFSLGVINIFNSLDKPNRNSEKKEEDKKRRRYQKKRYQLSSHLNINKKPLLAVMIITLLVVLAGWQAFNGSIYPMRAYPGSYLVGNAVEPKGAFSPTSVSSSVIKAYDIVTENYSQTNLSSQYNTLWIGGPDFNDFAWAEPPLSVSVSGIKELAENSLYSDTPAYLISHGIRYVVISNEDIQPNVPNPFTQFGFSNYSQALNFFKNSGLEEMYNENQTAVFLTDSSINLYYDSNLLINATNGIMSPALYKLFRILGYNVTFTNSGISTGLYNTSQEINIITPSLLPFSGVANLSGERLNYTIAQGQYKYLNSSEYPGHLDYYQNHSLGQYTDYLPGNLTTTAWDGNTTFLYNNGSINASTENASVSIDYNNALAGQIGGVQIQNPSSQVALNLQFVIEGSQNFRGSPYILLLGEATNASISTFYQAYPLHVTNESRKISIGAMMPPGTEYVGFRIGFNGFSGNVSVSDVNFSVSSMPTNGYSPFGSYLYAKDLSFHIIPGFQSEYILLSNSTNNLINNVYFTEISRNQNYKISGNVLGVVLVKNTTLRELSTDNAVVNSIVTNSYIVRDGDIILHDFRIGNDGSYIFHIKNSTTLEVTYNQKYSNLLLSLYISIDVTLLVFIFVPIYYIHRRTGGNRHSP